MNQEKEVPEIEIYTDGGADPNPGKGGFGVIMKYKGHTKEFKEGYVLTTNNRMELKAVIYGLKRLKQKSIVTVYTDSQYVVSGIEKGWAKKWKSNNGYRTKNSKASNYDLWVELLDAIEIHQNVTFIWIKGHAGHPENERCDQLAGEAIISNELLEDIGYKSEVEEETIKENIENQSKSKVKVEGDFCKKCNTEVVKQTSKKRALKPNQNYYFEYYLVCPKCKTMYMVEDAKRYIKDSNNQLFN